MNANETHVLTYGQMLVGYNPQEEHGEVKTTRERFALIIDTMNDILLAEAVPGISNSERVRQFKIAITQAETACLHAIKALYFSN